MEWRREGTTPDAIEGALRELLTERSREARAGEEGGLVPARVLNMVVFVESARAEEVSDRLSGVGRYHASRTVVLSYEPAREQLNACVSIAPEGKPRPGEVSLLRETAVVEIGERHLDDLVTIVDPLVISDLSTLLWAPHRRPEMADPLLDLAQATLIDSVEEPVWSAAIERACGLSERAYVVDLAWLRSTPWRERVAATFDGARMRRELEGLRTLEIRHHPRSTVAAMLFVGWLASRLDWQLARARIDGSAGPGGTLRKPEGAQGAPEGTLGAPGNALSGHAHTRAGASIELRLRAEPRLRVPGLAGVRLCGPAGLDLTLDRGPGGLHAVRRDQGGNERAWTLLGASRGEGGILGEGIRQALLRDPTYLPALRAAQALLPEPSAGETPEAAAA